MSRRALLVMAAEAVVLTAVGARADPSGVLVAALTEQGADNRGALPQGMATADLARYRELFDLQRRRHWAEAEALMPMLGDNLLLGHLLAQRLLSPKAPRADYAELAAWLERYADLPQAYRIYKLALARKPHSAAKPRAPEPPPVSASDRLWRQGLAAWRGGDFAGAADQLTRLADDPRLDGPERARAAFWAARANLRAHRARLLVPLLRIAADTADQFYGALAQRMLDDVVDFDRGADMRASWGLARLMIRYPAARRMLALAAIGEQDLAKADLRCLSAQAPSDLIPDLAALTQGFGRSNATPRRTIAERAGAPARPPLPAWQPADGYRLDPHLVHAVVRAESGFDPLARSPRGALGLMQIMPDTARHVAARTRIAYAGDDWLLDPANNLTVGQAWLRQLADRPTVHGSLLHLLAAYNAGEGRLQGWLANELEPAADDPLLFIESVPISETQAYLKKVLANLWADQALTGETSPSLRALAENRWPEVDPVPRPKPKPSVEGMSDARAN